jgi:hypothetical protein
MVDLTCLGEFHCPVVASHALVAITSLWYAADGYRGAVSVPHRACKMQPCACAASPSPCGISPGGLTCVLFAPRSRRCAGRTGPVWPGNPSGTSSPPAWPAASATDPAPSPSPSCRCRPNSSVFASFLSHARALALYSQTCPLLFRPPFPPSPPSPLSFLPQPCLPLALHLSFSFCFLLLLI